MNRNLALLTAFSLALPLAVEVPVSTDTLTTAPELATPGAGGERHAEVRLGISGGIAYYAFITRGCEGQVIDKTPVHARDAAASLEYRFPQGFGVGVRGGILHDEIGTSADGFPIGVAQDRTYENSYVNPHAFFFGGPAEFGVGWVFHEKEFITAGEGAREQEDHPLNDFSAHVRLGRVDRKYFAIEWMESEPLYSGGGYLTIGIGGASSKKTVEFYGGLAAGGPYEGAGLLARVSFPLGAGARLGIQARGGVSGGEPAAGVSLRLEHRSRLGD